MVVFCWWLFVGVGALLLLSGFYFMAGRNSFFLLNIFITIFEVFHLCLRGRTRLYV